MNDLLSNLLNRQPYELNKTDKQRFLVEQLNQLHKFHFENCKEYRSIMTSLLYDGRSRFKSVEEFPYLPVRLFKELNLKSVSDSDVFKTLTSSGTTSQRPSRIYLDKETAKFQTTTLVKILQSYLGKQRLPMIILDTDAVLKDPKSFSARGAGILGLSNFGRNHFYALDEAMDVKIDELMAFVSKFSSQPILMFGFTFMVWKYFYKALKDNSIHLPEGILIHSGGWKKLEEERVSNDIFKSSLEKKFGIKKVHNFYGMVEQVGSVFVECENGNLHAPIYSDILVRDPYSFEVCPIGQEGVIEAVSVIPKSYPGHVLLTEDLGRILGEDDCKCGRKGTYFEVLGRLKQAEVRGCSDTHASETV